MLEDVLLALQIYSLPQTHAGGQLWVLHHADHFSCLMPIVAALQNVLGFRIAHPISGIDVDYACHL